MMSADERLNAPDSSHSILSASRAFFACQKLVASTATPLGTSTTYLTPGTFAACEASNLATFAPKRGGCATTAVRILGRRTSCVNIAVPLHFALESVRGAPLPI